MALPIKYEHQVRKGLEVFHDSEEVIETLADLAGFTAHKVIDDMGSFVGYVMEAQDKELREFLAAEDAAEADEMIVLGSFDVFFAEE